jgi:hypothetical protein
MAKATKVLPVEKKITDYMEKHRISDNDLAIIIGKSNTHIHFVFRCNNKNKRPLTQKNLDLINANWGTKFKLPA